MVVITVCNYKLLIVITVWKVLVPYRLCSRIIMRQSHDYMPDRSCWQREFASSTRLEVGSATETRCRTRLTANMKDVGLWVETRWVCSAIWGGANSAIQEEEEEWQGWKVLCVQQKKEVMEVNRKRVVERRRGRWWSEMMEAEEGDGMVGTELVRTEYCRIFKRWWMQRLVVHK